MAEPLPPRFEWIGGALPLDFVNTVSWTDAGPAEERLGSYDDLADWAVEARIVSPKAGGRLRRRARREPGSAGAALVAAHRLRALLHSAFAAATERRRVPPTVMAELNAALAEAGGRVTLAQGGDDWTLELRDSAGLRSMLPTIVWQGAQLLASGDRRRLKQCASADCGWVFLDESRNGSRRWCDMRVCGNNEKARRFYRRHRTGASPNL